MKIWLLLLSLIFLSGCQSVEYSKSSQVQATPEWGPVEIKKTVRAMAGSLSSFFQNTQKAPFLELGSIQNRTSEHINTNLLSSELTTALIQENIVFVDSSKRERAIQEAKLAQQGLVLERSEIEAGELLSPNFILEGELNDNVRYQESEKTQYLVITLKLVEIQSGAIRWQKQQEFLKITKRRTVGW